MDQGQGIAVAGFLGGGHETFTRSQAGLGIDLRLGRARARPRQGAGNIGAVFRQPEHGEIGVSAGGQCQLEGTGTLAAFQRLGERGEFDAFRRLEQLAGGLAHQRFAVFPDQVIGGAGDKQNVALHVHLKQEVGIGEGKAEQSDRQGHDAPQQGAGTLSAIC